MPEESSLISSIPDQPLTKSAVKAIDAADGVLRAISPTWQTPIQGDGEFTEDIIVITDSRVRYLARERGEGWAVMRNETYMDDDEFEQVMDDVHDYACEYSEMRIERKVSEDQRE